MIDAAAWYLALAVIGLAALLPAALLCERLHSHGLLYARPVGLAVVGLAAWLIAWSGLLAYGTLAVSVPVVALVLWSATIAWRRRDVLARLRERLGLLVAGEVLLLLVFVLVALARAQAPDAINTEKPMDLMLLVAVHRAESMPPPDPWLAGETISYYHLGHTALDALARLSGNEPGTAFNLGVATAGALAAAAALGVVIDVLGLGGIVRRRGAVAGGIVAVATLLLVATAPGLVQVLAANGLGGASAWGWLGVENVPVEVGATDLVPDAWLWWWPATRVLPGTITEFPAFTLLLGDPHAHLLALPLVLVIVALAVQTFEGGTPLSWRRWFGAPDGLVLTAILFAALAMTNAWDLIVIGPLWGLAAIIAAARVGWSPGGAVIVVLRWAAAPAALAVALAWPFLGRLDTPDLGVALVTNEHSDPLRWALVWLPPLLPSLVALPFVWRRASLVRYWACALVVVSVLLAWIVLALASAGTEALTARSWGWLTVAVLVALLVAVIVQASVADTGRRRAESAALALLAAGIAVLLLLELVRVDDAFAGRMNTVFKFGFQAWAILALAGGALIGLAVGRFDGMTVRGRLALVQAGYALGVALVLLSLYSPAMAVSRGREGQTPGLDATRHLEEHDPGLAAAVEWSRVHLDPSEHVIAQAIGESYGRGNRMSTFSGVPAVLAWPNHQRQWRGEIAETARRRAIEAIYTGSKAEVLEAIETWGVTHVLVGPEEREAFGLEIEDRFDGWPAVVDERGVRLLEAPR